MTKVKVCGITNESDASYASNLGCEYIGIIFTKESKRFVKTKIAKQIQKQIASSTKLVGVFKNENANIVNKISDYLDLDLVQLHGSESQNYIDSIERPVIKVLEFEPGITNTTEISNRSKQFKNCSYFLLDKPKTTYPNSKSQIKNQMENQFPNMVSKLQCGNRKVMIAGGITAQSAKSIKAYINPYGFDVCSSIEDSPGVKNHNLMKELIKAIKY